MVKNHIKRLTAPRTWKIIRKDRTFITKPNPGAHSQILSVSINTFLKEIVHVSKTTKESKYMLTKQEILLNGKRIRDDKHAVGLFDIVKVPALKKNYRVIIDETGSIAAKEIKDDESFTLLKITGKKVLAKDKVQLNTMSGRNILVKDKEAKTYNTGDTVVVKLPENKVEKHIASEKGVHVFVFIGKHVGKHGTLETVDAGIAKVKTGKETFETNKEYIFVTGKDKPEI